MDVLKEVIVNIFGTYEPVTYEVYNSVTDSYDTVIASGMAGVDWMFIAGVLLFGITAFCVFRIIGGIIKNV